MARSRNIKPAFFENDLLAECSPLARLLFAGLWCLADRNGVLEDRRRRIKAQILPYDDCNIVELVDELIERKFVQKIKREGVDYLWVVEFQKHQNPHRNEESKHFDPNSEPLAPKPEGSGADTEDAPEQHPSDPADSLLLIDDSLSLNDEGGSSESDQTTATPDDVLAAFNKAFGQQARMTDARRKTLTTRLKETWWRTNWQKAIDKGKNLPFMKGTNDRGWKANIDFFIKSDSATRIIEGKYDGQPSDSRGSRGQSSTGREFAAETF